MGGLVALAVVTFKAHRGDYGWAQYPGVRYTAIYWHFLGAVWLLLILLRIGG